MFALDRPLLRRRSQSEQIVPTKAAFAMIVLQKDASGAMIVSPQVATPTPSTVYAEHDARPLRTRTPLISRQVTLASIIERKKASLPLKPDAAVLAAAAKKQKKHVFFSTPSVPVRHSPVLLQDRASVFPGPGTPGKFPSLEQHLPPPPYTPAGVSMNAPYHAGSIRSSFDYACTPACTTAGHSPAHIDNSNNQVHRKSVTTIFPSVIAASEALRINLGLDRSAINTFGESYQGASPLNVSLERSHSVPGLPMPPSLQFALGPTPYPVRSTIPAMHHIQHKLFTAMAPSPGMTQPLGNMSPNLPPVVNTGHKGPMKVQPGDWSCLVCSFINWRRRKFCMRCCPFAEGNANIHPSMLASMAAAQNPLYASMTPAGRSVYPVYATPPRHTTLRGHHTLLDPAVHLTGPFIQPNMPQNHTAYAPMQAGPVLMPGAPALQPPFGPMPPAHNSGPVYRQVFGFQQDSSASAPAQQRHNSPEGATFLYDSGYGRYSHEQDTQLPAQQGKIIEIDRPVTPSPTGSQSSDCSFAFSNSPPSDADSPSTSINSNGSTSSVSSPESASKALRTPPSSKFVGFEHNGKVKESKALHIEDAATSIEHRLDSLRM